MATILQFHRKEEPNHKRPAGADKRPAGEIIIFPGVRIERWQAGEGWKGPSLASRKGVQRRKK